MASRRADLRTFRAAFERFLDHHLIDWSAALTFYAAISLIPALVITFGIVGLLGDSTLDQLAANLRAADDPGPVRDLVLEAIEELRANALGAGSALVIGIAGALWTASSYVGSFLRATAVIHGRATRFPFWKLRPLQLGITGGVIVAIAAVALAVIVTGPLAEWLGGLVGLEQLATTAWDLAKWPAIVLVVLIAFDVLEWAGSGRRRFRWLSPGAVLATAALTVGSVAYALYIVAFPDLNQVYGSLGAVVGFILWIWGANMALLYGVVLNAELESDSPGASA